MRGLCVAHAPKIMPKTMSVITGCSNAKPRMPPIGSVTPERKHHKRALLLEPVA